MSLVQIKVGGFGGQGVILSGTILGKAGAIYDQKNVTMTRSYGPEARGGACSAQILVSDQNITFPYVTSPDALIVLSQEAGNKYAKELNDGSALFYEKDLVKLNLNGKKKVLQYGIPSTRIAEELGNRLVQNIVMLGFFAKMNDAISKDAIISAIKKSVPTKTIEINLRAFENGYSYEG